MVTFHPQTHRCDAPNYVPYDPACGDIAYTTGDSKDNEMELGIKEEIIWGFP